MGKHTARVPILLIAVVASSLALAPPAAAQGDWTSTKTAGAPAARASHVAVWTGSKMLVWGGFGGGLASTGGLYDPATDTWSAISTAGAPKPAHQSVESVVLAVVRSASAGRARRSKGLWVSGCTVHCRERRWAMVGKRAGRVTGLAVLLGALVLPRAGFSEGLSELSAGQKIRITPLDRIEIPDVISVQDGKVASKGPLHREDGGRLLAVEIGQKTLRVPTPGTTVVGKLVAVDEETITLLRDKAPREISVPKAAVARLEVGRGGQHRQLAIAGGAVAGLAIGAPVGWHEGGWGAPAVAALFGAVGAAVGWQIGKACAGPHWEAVSPREWHLAIAPRRGGAVAMAMLSF